MNSRVDRLTPKLKRHGVIVEHAPSAFNHAPVVTLNNKVLLRCVRSGELMANTFKLDESLKILRQELTPIVSPQFIHGMPCLFLRQLIENLEFGKNFGAVSHEENEPETAVVIVMK